MHSWTTDMISTGLITSTYASRPPSASIAESSEGSCRAVTHAQPVLRGISPRDNQSKLAPPSREPSPNALYKERRNFQRPTVLSKYAVLGFISSGTYGRVYKARIRKPNQDSSPAGLLGTPGATNTGKRLRLSKDDHDDDSELVAIKKFKPDKEGEIVTYTGISQSACREIMINREISHENVTSLKEVMLEEKSIYLVFEYAEHDFLQIVHHHSSTRTILPPAVLKSLLWQLFNGVAYLHDNWVVHRDLKPANILVNSAGVVKIGDLGLARFYYDPLQSLYTSDKIVVTVWYRSPELLLGARHYTPAVDLWSMGCIFGELLGLRPMFKGEEAKIDLGAKKGGVPFQKDQLTRIFEVLGSVDRNQWPALTQMPEYTQLSRFERYSNNLQSWYMQRAPRGSPHDLGLDLLRSLLTYDPEKRLTARQALEHRWWQEDPKPHSNAFVGLPHGVSYPARRITHDESDPKLSQQGGPTVPHKGSNFAGIGSGNLAFPSSAGRVNKRGRME